MTKIKTSASKNGMSFRVFTLHFTFRNDADFRYNLESVNRNIRLIAYEVCAIQGNLSRGISGMSIEFL